MLDWLVVGGGLHGTYLSLWLTSHHGVPRDRLRVIDPREHPLDRWRHCARNSGVDVLRSPLVHHLDPDAGSLHRFAARRHPGRADMFTGPYRRPSIGLFEDHASWIVESRALLDLRLRARATGFAPVPGGLRVETDAGAIEAREVVVAVGHTDRLARPAWSRGLPLARVAHVFDDGWDIDQLLAGERVAIVGGGLSAAQCALAVARRTGRAPLLVTRHEPRLAAFDQDPCWLGPKCLAGFDRLTSLADRRRAIDAARQRGAMPREVAARLDASVGRGRVDRRLGEVDSAIVRGKRVEVGFRDGGCEALDRVILATGFEHGRPGGDWLDAAVIEFGLPIAPCGFPVLDRSLRWRPHLRVVGGLAELVVGPSARNLAGVRMAAELLAA